MSDKLQNRQGFFWLLAAITASFCLFVITLPAFPTEDGPIHLYFATILGDLLAHSSPLYAQYYYVHHVLPPYSLHYYLLIVLMKVVSAPMAEKIFVCLIFCTFAFGLRFLLTGIGRAGDVLSLFVAALLLNWPLGMGFENFSLSLGMACWALGLWVRLPKAENARRFRVGFVMLLALMTLTHPVPVVMTAGFVSMDIALGWLVRSMWKQKTNTLAADLFTLAVGAGTLAYIYVYTDKKRTIAEAQHHPPTPLAQLRHFAQLHGLAYFGGQNIGANLYRGSLYFVFFAGLILGAVCVTKHLRTQVWTPAISWLLAALLFIPALAVIPIDINGSHFFAERLVIFIWIALLASASGYPSINRPLQRTLAAVAVCIAAGILGMAQLYTRPAGQKLAELETAPVHHRGKVGLLLPANADQYDFTDHLQFYPLIWGGTYYFRQSGSVLLNTPWMDLSLLPLGATPHLLTYTFPLPELENYHELREDLLQSDASRNAVLPRTDFILFAGSGPHVDQATTAPVLTLPPTIPWACAEGNWYLLCNR